MPKAKRTLVTVIQDESGSMAVRQDATINGFNEYIENLKNDAEGEVLVTLIKFNTAVKTPIKLTKVGHVAKLDGRTYTPGGMTALFDAVAQGVEDTAKEAKKKDTVIVVVMTDGQENSSIRVGQREVADLIEEKRQEGWEFVFLGAGEDAWSGGIALGIGAGSTLSYGIDAHDHQAAYSSLSSVTLRKTRNADEVLAFNDDERKAVGDKTPVASS